MSDTRWLDVARASLIKLGKMVILALFFYAIHHYLATRATGKHLDAFEKALLQEALLGSPPANADFEQGGKRLPIIVDISRIHPDKSKPVDRERLDEVVEAISRAAPAGIGIDLDFSNPQGTEQGGPLPEDMSYLKKWTNLENVRVGVWHRAAYGRQEWLGVEDFAKIAAGMALPADDPLHAFLYIQPKQDPLVQMSGHRVPKGDLPDKRPEPLIMMPAALWVLGHDRWWRGDDNRTLDDLWKQAQRDERHGHNFEFGLYAIDYSYAKAIQKETIEFRDPGELTGLNVQKLLRDRQVLVGDLEDSKDHVCSPGAVTPLSGALVHACSLASLNRGLFLEVGKELGTILEAGLLLLVWVVLFGMQLKQKEFNPDESIDDQQWAFGSDLVWEPQYLEILWFGLLGVTACIAGIWMIRSRNLFWPDFLWISLTLFLHPFLTEPFFRIIFRVIPGVIKTVHVTFAGGKKK